MDFKLRTGALTGTTFGDLSNYDAFRLIRKNLPVAIQNLTFNRFATMETQTTGSGLEVGWNRWSKLSQRTSPIAEGATPGYEQMTNTILSATMKQYGGWVPLTDIIKIAFDNDYVQQITEKQAIQAAETIDTLCFNTIKAGTAVVYGRSAVSAGRADVDYTIAATWGIGATTASAPSASDKIVDLAMRTLDTQNARHISKMTKASVNIATEPIRKAYMAFIHPDCCADLETCPSFVPYHKYSNAGPMIEGEVGSVKNIRFLATTQATPFEDSGKSVTSTDKLLSTSASNYDVYPIVVVSEDAYSAVNMSGYASIVPMIVNPKPSSSDPLSQRGSVGWKTFHASKILNDNWMVRIEVAASSLL